MPKKQLLVEAEQIWWDYWEAFGEFLAREQAPFKPTKGHGHCASSWGLGRSGFNIGSAILVQLGTIGVFITFTGPNAKTNFRALYQQRDAIENELGFSLDWDESPKSKRSVIRYRKQAVVEDQTKWPEYHQWTLETLVAIDSAFRKRVVGLA